MFYQKSILYFELSLGVSIKEYNKLFFILLQYFFYSYYIHDASLPKPHKSMFESIGS